jgi:MYXO-CTERM domain-containing protein
MGVAYFGTNVAAADAEIGFDNLVIHPDYVPLDNAVGELGEFDLSIFVLKEDAPAEPTWFNREAITDDQIGAEITSVGFGITGPDASDSGIKRFAPLVLADYDENFLISKNFYNPNNANICSGDSGGPQFFYEGGFYIEGAVHSWGDQDCAVESGSTRVDIATEWILDQIEAVHGSRDVCEINGWYGDGLCHWFCDLPDPDCVPDGGTEEDAGVPDGGADAGSETGLTGGCGCTISSSASPTASALFFVLIGAFLLIRRRSGL